MKFLDYLNNYLQKNFNKESKIDGRLLVLAVLLVYFGLIFLDNVWGTYPQLWKSFGLPAMDSPYGPFWDLKEVLAGFDCMRSSNNTVPPKSCNFGYPPIWWSLSGLRLGESATLSLGFLSIIIFYLSTFLLIGRLNYQEGIFYSLFFCSPPIMLLVERANVDIIIYSCLFLALILIKRPERLSFRLVGYLIILGMAVLKLFPIFGLSLIIKEKKNHAILIAGSLLGLFLAYYLSIRKELKVLGNYFLTKSDWITFGYRNIFYRIKKFYNQEIMSDIEIKMIFTLGSFLSLFLGVKVIINLGQKVKLWLSKPYIQSGSNSSYIDDFRLGSSLYIGNFLIIGKVFDYKFAFLLFALPQMLFWIKSCHQMSFSSSFALLGIIATLYLSKFNTLGIDELINWLLLGYFIYSFCVSLPEWLTKSIHNTFKVSRETS